MKIYFFVKLSSEDIPIGSWVV